LPAPWRVEGIAGSHVLKEANGQTVVYGVEAPVDAAIAKALTREEARRMARNIAKLPVLLRKPS